MHFSDPTWSSPGHDSVLLASRRYDGSTSRKTKGSMADSCLLCAGRGSERPEIQVFSRLDIWHKDFLGKQFVNCRWSRSHHTDVLMDFVFFISPPLFYEGSHSYEGALANIEPTLDTCWFGRVVLCRFQVKTDKMDDKGSSVLMDCNCALIDCLYNYAPGGYKCIFLCQAKLCPNNVQTYIKQNVNQTKCKPKHIPSYTKLYQNLANL